MRFLGEKEIESLKWQYLQCSELYREYCDWQKKKTENPKLTLPGKFKPATGLIEKINPIVMLYIKYGDIHETSFDDWYERYYKGDVAEKGTSFGCVDDLAGADPNTKYLMRNTLLSIIEGAKSIGDESLPCLKWPSSFAL